MIYHLLCEGPCSKRGDRHTAHVEDARTHNGISWTLWYRCVHCGTKRVYGREEVWVREPEEHNADVS